MLKYLLPLLLTGCAMPAYNAHYENNLDTQASKDIFEKVVNNLEDYNHSKFMHSDGNGMHTKRIEVVFENMEETKAGRTTCKFTHCKIMIASRYKQETYDVDGIALLRLIMLHEIGHSFGLVHVDEICDIMHYQLSFCQTTDNAYLRYNEALNNAREH